MGQWFAVLENEASTWLCSPNLVLKAGNHQWQGWEGATLWEHGDAAWDGEPLLSYAYMSANSN